MKRSAKPIIIAVAAAAVIGAGAMWYLPSLAPNSGDEKSDMSATAERRDIETTLLLTGEVQPAFSVEVKPEVGGKIRKIHVKTGEFVKKGEPLVTIDDTDLVTEEKGAQTEIDGAQLSVDKTRGNYERAKSLFDEKLISREVFANLEADLLLAENSLEKAQRRYDIVSDKLKKTQIIAPANGTVLDDLIDEGQVVSASASVNSGTILMNFADLSKLLIESHVNQVDAPRLEVGQEISVNVAEGEAPVKARIDQIAPLATVKNNIKGFEVKAVIEENDGRLKPGMSVSMDVPVARVTDAVSVPVTAVFRERNDQVVYVRNGTTTEKRKVVVGLSDMSFAEIKSGLKEGEQILLVEPARGGGGGGSNKQS